MGLLSPGRAPSSAQGCPGDVIQPYIRYIGREVTSGWLCRSLATGNRSETEWEVLLIHGARFSFLKGLGFHFPPKKDVRRGISLAEVSACIQYFYWAHAIFLGGRHTPPILQMSKQALRAPEAYSS